MIKFKFEKETIEVPTEWSEVSVTQFIMPEFISGHPIHFLSILSGIPAGKLSRTTKDLSKHFAKTIQFMQDKPMGWQGKPGDKTLKFMGKDCLIPANIEAKEFGQSIMFGNALQKAKYVYAAIPDAIAIYFGPMIYPEDWYDRMDELKREVGKLPITDVAPVVDFFLRLSKQSTRSGKSF